MGDLLYRVQGGRLPAEGTMCPHMILAMLLLVMSYFTTAVPVSSRHVATHHFQPVGGGGAGMVGGAVVQLQDTAIGIDVIMVVCRTLES